MTAKDFLTAHIAEIPVKDDWPFDTFGFSKPKVTAHFPFRSTNRKYILILSVFKNRNGEAFRLSVSVTNPKSHRFGLFVGDYFLKPLIIFNFWRRLYFQFKYLHFQFDFILCLLITWFSLMDEDEPLRKDGINLRKSLRPPQHSKPYCFGHWNS